MSKIKVIINDNLNYLRNMVKTRKVYWWSYNATLRSGENFCRVLIFNGSRFQVRCRIMQPSEAPFLYWYYKLSLTRLGNVLLINRCVRTRKCFTAVVDLARSEPKRNYIILFKSTYQPMRLWRKKISLRHSTCSYKI